MAAISSGSRLAGKQTSDIQFQSLGDKATSSALSILHTLVRTSFGPRGKLKLLHNNSGGHSTVTSSSMRLFDSLSVSQPVLRLLTSVIQGHIGSYSDGGLFTALFALNLIKNALAVDVPRRLVMEVYELLLRNSIEYLSSTQCSVCKPISFDNLEHLHVLVRSIISTKPGCGLASRDMEHISGLIVRAFLKTFQGGSDKSCQGMVNHMTLQGQPPSESQLFDGVLFAAPQIPVYRSRPVKCLRLSDGSIQVAVFTTSLAGDSEDVAGVAYEVLDSSDAHADLGVAVLSNLEDLVRTLVAADVGLVCCQRVVHPVIKQRLREQGLFVIDRLGSSHIAPIQVLTGAILLGSFVQTPPEGAYGRLDALHHVVLGGRSYLHLVRRATNVCTLVTCQRTESASDELKHVAVVGLDVLRRSLSVPLVLAGGGCWQVHLAATMRTHLVVNSADWCRQLACSPLQLSQAGHSFCLAVDQIAMAASDNHDHLMAAVKQHHWTWPRSTASRDDDRPTEGTRCCCGENASTNTTQFNYLGQENSHVKARVTGDCVDATQGLYYRVADLFEVSVNGLKTAVAAANMVLGIQHYIHDTN